MNDHTTFGFLGTGVLLILACFLILMDGGLRNKLIDKSLPNQPYLLLFFGFILLVGTIASTLHYRSYFISFSGTSIFSTFTVTSIVVGLAFVIVQSLLFYFLFKYKTGPGKTADAAANKKGRIELIWTLLLAGIFLFLFGTGQRAWRNMTNTESKAFEIEVVAEQFTWLTRYPGHDGKLGRSALHLVSLQNDIGIDSTDNTSHDDFIPLQMHVPANTPIRLVLRSKDVIHSFFIPMLHVKMDAVPGMYTYVNFTAPVTTQEMRRRLNDERFNYEVACAELCGEMHFVMKLILVVDNENEFNEWSEHQHGWLSQQRRGRL